MTQMASRFALACRLRRVLAWLTQIIFLWLTQKPQKAQTLRVAAPSLPSGMYTLGETPTAVSDSDAAHSVKVCEVCVRQKNQRETIISEKGTANAPDGKHKRSECASVLSALSV